MTLSELKSMVSRVWLPSMAVLLVVVSVLAVWEVQATVLPSLAGMPWQSKKDAPVSKPERTSTPTPSATPAPTFTPTPTPFFIRPTATPEPRFEPVRLRIPKLGIDTTVEHVGLTSDNAMDTPKDPWNVSWLSTSYAPGQTGSAVLAGHVDTPTGPAIFQNLGALAPGDTIEVLDASGVSLTFTVSRVENYPADAFPFTEVFDANDTRRLNLITCAGTFNTIGPGYSHRLVVYSEL
ncbi:MAG: class F sortase [Patescibacteria group bacterium]|nr:class F sortase [Patescibacteria group bacterium]